MSAVTMAKSILLRGGYTKCTASAAGPTQKTDAWDGQGLDVSFTHPAIPQEVPETVENKGATTLM